MIIPTVAVTTTLAGMTIPTVIGMTLLMVTAMATVTSTVPGRSGRGSSTE